MRKTRKFILTEDHIKLLKNAYVDWFHCETGAPTINPKRPYGNGNVAEDIAEILGEEESPDEAHEERLLKVHRQTEDALQIILCTGEFRPGTYVTEDPYDNTSWVLDKEADTFLEETPISSCPACGCTEMLCGHNGPGCTSNNEEE